MNVTLIEMTLEEFQFGNMKANFLLGFKLDTMIPELFALNKNVKMALKKDGSGIIMKTASLKKNTKNATMSWCQALTQNLI